MFHGIQINEPVTGVRPITEHYAGVIGLVATATAAAGAATTALDAAFPLNRPVLVTDVRAAIGAAGTGGTLAKALSSIADQGSPIIVVVRVAVGQASEGVTQVAAQSTLTVGGTSGGLYTGAQALLAAESVVGVRPRILGAPGLDTPAVVTALAVVARKLRGFVYSAIRTAAGAIAADVAAAVTAREDFSDRELMLIWPEATGWDGQAVATALGLRAVIDAKVGWHKSLSNVAIAGVTGLSKDVHFDLRDASTDAGVLNGGDVTTIVRMTGYRFWGNRTCSDEPFFAFESAVRTGQALQDEIADAWAGYIDQPMTVGLVRDLVEEVNARLRLFISQGKLIGGNAWFDSSLNPAEALAAGALAIDYDYTPCAPLEGLTGNQRITAKYYLGFGDQLASTAG